MKHRVEEIRETLQKKPKVHVIGPAHWIKALDEIRTGRGVVMINRTLKMKRSTARRSQECQLPCSATSCLELLSLRTSRCDSQRLKDFTMTSISLWANSCTLRGFFSPWGVLTLLSLPTTIWGKALKVEWQQTMPLRFRTQEWPSLSSLISISSRY